MSALDMLARAETSDDLQHHSRPCDVDVLGAAGMAAYGNHAHVSLFRLKYLNDPTEIGEAKALFIMWTRRAMINRKVETHGASRVGVQALTAWIGDVCHVCQGRKHKVIDGTPTLSDKPCGACKGTGRNKIMAHGDIGEVMRDVAERADSAILALQSGVDYKMGRE